MSDVTSFHNVWSGLFAWKKTFNKAIGDWDGTGTSVGALPSWSGLFAWKKMFNGDVGDWDVGQATWSGLFAWKKTFNEDVGDWDVGQATSFKMFQVVTATAICLGGT